MKIKLLSQDLDGFPATGVRVSLRLETPGGLSIVQGVSNLSGEVRFDLSSIQFSSATLWLEGEMVYSGPLTEKLLTYYL